MAIDILIILKFIKFCSVGTSGMVVDFGTTYLFKEKIKINKYISNGIGFSLAASSNYILNRIWTFNSQVSGLAFEFSKFFLISCIGLIICNYLIVFLHKYKKIPFYWAKLLSIGGTLIWNFSANLLYTFS